MQVAKTWLEPQFAFIWSQKVPAYKIVLHIKTPEGCQRDPSAPRMREGAAGEASPQMVPVSLLLPLVQKPCKC